MGLSRPGNQRLAVECVAAVASACPASAGTCPAATADGDLSTAADGYLPTTGSGNGHLHDACSCGRRSSIPAWGRARGGSDRGDGQDRKRGDTSFRPVFPSLLRGSRTSAMVIGLTSFVSDV